MTRTWRQRLLAAALVVLAALTGGSRATAADNLSPVVIDSPAWAELMALPLQPGEPLPFYAADLVEAWGRPVEAIQLRRALLHRHLRVAVGEPFPTGGHVADVWQQARGNALSTADLMAAHDAALNRNLGFDVLASTAPGSSGSDLVPLGPQAPGFWADPQGRRLGVHLQLRNTGAVGLAPSSLLLRLSEPAPGLALVCEPTGTTRLLPPQQSAPWWCEAAPPAGSPTLQRLRAGQGPALQPGRVAWASLALQEPASAREMARDLAGRPPVFLRSFAERNSACERQGTCVQTRSVPRSAEAVKTEQERAAATDRQFRKDVRRNEGLATLLPWAYLLLGVTLYVLVARFVGVIPAALLSLAQGPAMAYWYLRASGGIDDYLKLVVLIFLAASGLFIAAVGSAVHKRFFANL